MKDIIGYEGKYAVDEDGNVWSLNWKRTGKTKKLKPSDAGRGYPCVSLHMNGKGKTLKIHRLMAEAYLTDFCDDLVVDHIDRDKTNNKLSNLRMITQQQNVWNQDAKGYYLCKTTGRWRAQIMKSFKTVSLGRFDTKEEAHQAYLKAKETLHAI